LNTNSVVSVDWNVLDMTHKPRSAEASVISLPGVVRLGNGGMDGGRQTVHKPSVSRDEHSRFADRPLRSNGFLGVWIWRLVPAKLKCDEFRRKEANDEDEDSAASNGD
jgi:hypothetical protein